LKLKVDIESDNVYFKGCEPTYEELKL